MSLIWGVLAIIAVLLLWIGLSYNRFVSQRTLIQDSWADVDTELKRRYDLVPNLVASVQQYASHEREVFENVAKTRSVAETAQGAAQQSQAGTPFVAALGRLMGVAENYPQLKANENFLSLQTQLAVTEDRIQAARRLYNANVQTFNQRVQSVPSNIVANAFGFHNADFFQLDNAMRSRVEEAPSVNGLMSES